jgi:hypothetical protein
MWISAIPLALKELLQLINTISDPDKKKKAWELVLEKRAYKALEAAETIMHGVDSFLNKSISEKQFKKIYRKHRSVFFAND